MHLHLTEILAVNIDKNIIHTNANYKDYLENSVTNSFFLKSTNEEEVNSIIKQMKTNKAIGPNSIPTKTLKISQQIANCKTTCISYQSFFFHRSFPGPVKNSKYYTWS